MDAKTLTLTVAVTFDDISDGKPDDSCRCAVANGLRRAAAGVPGVTQVVVGAGCLALCDDDCVTWQCDQPPEVAAFIEAFDDRRPVHPFAFVATFEAVG